MFIVKEGYPFIIASLVVAAIVYFLFGAYWAVIPVVLAVYFAYMMLMERDNEFIYFQF